MPERIRVRVISAENEEQGIKSFTLSSADGQPLPSYTPGSHIDVHTDSKITRQYSLITLVYGPVESYKIAIKRESESRGGSAWMHDVLKAGDLLEIGLPRNNFELSLDDEKYILIAGGIGITPILPMFRQLIDIGKSADLHYFTRSTEHTPLRRYISDLPAAVNMHIGLTPNEVELKLREILSEPNSARVYYCGPAPLMKAVEVAAGAEWAPDRLVCEHFSARADIHDADASFDVELVRSGRTLTVPPGRSIVAVLAEHGLIVETSCGQGICGTCVTRVLGGIPDHRDDYLLDDEKDANDQMALCVSRSKSSLLKLDL